MRRVRDKTSVCAGMRTGCSYLINSLKTQPTFPRNLWCSEAERIPTSPTKLNLVLLELSFLYQKKKMFSHSKCLTRLCICVHAVQYYILWLACVSEQCLVATKSLSLYIKQNNMEVGPSLWPFELLMIFIFCRLWLADWSPYLLIEPMVSNLIKKSMTLH